MDESDKRKHLYKIVDDIGICMLSSHDGEIMHARPMAAHVEAETGEILFLTDVESHKQEEIARDPQVMLAFADVKANSFATINGTASLSHDRATIEKLWSPFAKAWWDDKDDPSIRVLRVTPIQGQYWDSPGRIVSVAKMLIAAATDKRPDMGENEKLNL